MREDAAEDKESTPVVVDTICKSSEETFLHVLLPVFLVTTRLGDKVDQLIVSGIDGSIRRRQPVSAWKVGFAALAVGAFAAAWPWLNDWL